MKFTANAAAVPPRAMDCIRLGLVASGMVLQKIKTSTVECNESKNIVIYVKKTRNEEV